MRLFRSLLTGISALSLFATSLAAEPASLHPTLGTETLEGVRLVDRTQATLNQRPMELLRVAHGFRRKWMALFWADVSTIELFSRSPSGLDRSSGDAFLKSLLAQKEVGFRMTFVRKVTSSQALAGLKDGLEANGIDPEGPMMKPVLDIVAKMGNFQKGSELWALGREDGEHEHILFKGGTFDTREARVIPGAMKAILSIWLGKPADSGIEEIQKALLKSQPVSEPGSPPAKHRD